MEASKVANLKSIILPFLSAIEFICAADYIKLVGMSWLNTKQTFTKVGFQLNLHLQSHSLEEEENDDDEKKTAKVTINSV